MAYFAVAYAHVIRWEKADTASEACRLAYGLVVPDRMTVAQADFNPKYASQKVKRAFLEKLENRHLEKTGSVIK